MLLFLGFDAGYTCLQSTSPMVLDRNLALNNLSMATVSESSNVVSMCTILGFHTGGYEFYLLGYDAV
jgi:hypothetical protein